ncbi:MAG: penicillin-binding protein 2 [Candidatus Kaiserbacteria bacterium]|nr:penicillin-binding protein 2 [Candidatus Kaiserbacteria bacterium]
MPLSTKYKLDSPYTAFYVVIAVALLSIFILYDNQFNKKVEGNTGIFLPFRSVGDRGNIYFIDKEDEKHLAATTHFGYNLNISPLEIEDAEEVYEHLSEEIDIDRKSFFKSAEKSEKDEYEIIERDIPESIQEKIQARIDQYGLKGVWLEPFKKREYINGSLAAHTLGFVSVDEEQATRGQYGVENIFDDVLSSANRVPKTAATTVLRQLGELPPENDRPSAGNVTLTIDINVQRQLEEQLRRIQYNWGAQKVGGIVMDPNDGAIVAIGAVPSFNPNTFGQVTDYSVFNNPIVEDVYEMGSVFKALTAAIGIDSGRVSLRDSYTDYGQVIVDGEIISNYDSRGRGPNTSIQTILSHSLNTGAVFMLQKIGIGTYKDYIDEFRFDSITQVDLPKEIAGLVENLNSNREIEFATASFGQGIAVTPIAAARAFATLANGGFLVQPYVTKDIEQPQVGGVISGRNFTRERKRIFNTSATDKVTALLTGVYDRGILGGSLRNTQYSIAAKTGTAQLVDPQTGKYAENKFLHSFFGYLPASKPKHLIFLFAVDPKTKFASTSLSHPFAALANYIISYYAIPPDR